MSLASPPGAAANSGRNVVAVLGPTNTGKTHLAIERMLAHSSGIIGLPLRLLAREVYNRVVARVGADQVALITGEEKIVPPGARYRVCTVEAMPSEADAAFLAIDEIQLAGDLERGHVFTDRMLHLRGREETLLLGAATMRGIVAKLLPGANIVTRPRMSVLSWSGSKKITRLPQRSAAVAFSSDEVYAIAELIRRQRGGAAVVLGSLSPRARNAQVELFQSGDVDFLVATDAIGMGLNLDLDHVAFAADRKFDGFQYRKLSAAELGQIAGRAGRHMRDGTFGVTSRVEPFEDELVRALETHQFQPVKTIQWRNRDLDFSSIDALRDSLDRPPPLEGLTKAPPAVDMVALAAVARDAEVARVATSRDLVARLWEACQVPDYRKIAPANHAELVTTLFGFLARSGRIADDWLDRQVTYADRVEGDIDTLSNRIAHIRTWTFVANRPNWLDDPMHWQERTRAVEDRLSDALHERLTARFVDRRTSVLMRRLKEKAMLEAEITTTGDVLVEGQHVGRLAGFRFEADTAAEGTEIKALRAAAAKALAGEIADRAEKVATSPNTDFVLASDGTLRWRGAVIARVAEGDSALRPRLILLADDALATGPRDRVQARIDLWLASRIETLLKPLVDLSAAESLSPAARGIAFRLVENLGVIERTEIAEEIKSLDQESRAGMRTLGVRFGAHHIYVPALIKPGPAALLAVLWAVKHGNLDQAGDLILLAASGRTSFKADTAFPRALYRVLGYRVAGTMAVRVDIVERLADIIRPLLAWRPSPASPVPPDGAIDGHGFRVTVAMTSLLGCSGEDFASVLRAIGYRSERRPAPPPVAAQAPVEGESPVAEAAAADTPPTDDDAAVASAEDTPPSVEDASDDGVVAAEDTGDAAEAEAEDAADAIDAVDAAGPDETPDAVVTAPDEGEAPASDATGALEPEDATDAPVSSGDVPGDEVSAMAPETAPTDADQAAADVAAAVAPDGAAEAGEGAAEPAFIEIWRPHRQGRRPDHRKGGRPQRQDGRRDAAAPSAPQAEGRENRDSRPPRRERGGPGEVRQGSGRPDRDGKGRPDRDGKGRPRHGEGGRPDRQDRPPRPEREVRPERQKQADPLSPFAALAALKAQLESQKRDS
jgi:ATP-dependent RNA helicase SUPV3L1/SUV3